MCYLITQNVISSKSAEHLAFRFLVAFSTLFSVAVVMSRVSYHLFIFAVGNDRSSFCFMFVLKCSERSQLWFL
jgi:hypothetical protein